MSDVDPSGRNQLFEADRVLSARRADVGEVREERRRGRLWRLAAWLAVPAAFLWYRLADDRPFNVIAVPHVDWLIVAPVLFFGGLIFIMAGTHVMTGRSPHVVFRPEQIDVSLDDVVGIDPVKQEVIHSLNVFLANRSFAREMGGKPRRGIMFEGTPGTGKTHTAKAMAREAGVPFFYASATSFQSSFQGATGRKLRNYFKALRKAAESEGGAIGFIDEFDAIGSARHGMAGAMSVAYDPLAVTPPARTITSEFTGPGDLSSSVTELLVQLQSFDQPLGMRKVRGQVIDKINLLMPPHRQVSKRPVPISNIMLVASTNRADALDPALMRPGRFDRILHFDTPDHSGRQALIKHFLATKSHAPELDEPEQRAAIASVTQGWSPAQLEGLFGEALMTALRHDRTVMKLADVESARLTIEIGMGQPKAYTDRERTLIATHESGHAVAAYLTPANRRLEVLSIIKRRDALGLLAHGDREEEYTRSRTQMLALIQIALAGMGAEELWFGDVSTGPGGDLLYATNVAAQMVGAVGMGGTLISFAAIQNSGFNDTNIVGRVLGDDDGRARVDQLLHEQKAAVLELLDRNRHLVEALRDALLERDELIGHEITDVLEAAEAAHRTVPARRTARATAKPARTAVPRRSVIDLREPSSTK